MRERVAVFGGDLARRAATRRRVHRPRPAAARRRLPASCHDQRPDRRRPGPDPQGPADAAGSRTRSPRRRRGRRRRPGTGAGTPPGPGRHLDGRPHARTRRDPGHRPARPRRQQGQDPHADHLQPRRIRLPRHESRSQRLPAQGRHRRATGRRHPRGLRRRDAACPGHHPPPDRRLLPRPGTRHPAGAPQAA